jgi:DNA-binding NtrC family response regulator
MTIQVKLLRVLEGQQVFRVGSTKPRSIDVRFVAATNRDLEAEVERGAFRQDLFFRLNGISLVVPPLRDRISEIEGLTKNFISEMCRKSNRHPEPAVSPDAMLLMKRYGWPGNIRELRNLIERAVLLCSDGPITLADLPVEKMSATFAARQVAQRSPLVARTDLPAIEPNFNSLAAAETKPLPLSPEAKRVNGMPPPTDSSDKDLRIEMKAYERQRILDALASCAGNQTAAARLLGVSRRMLVNRLNAYNIPRPRKNRQTSGG